MSALCRTQKRPLKAVQKRSPVKPDVDLVGFWCLRMLVDLNGHRQFVGRGGFMDDEILHAIGMEEYEDEEMPRATALKLLKARRKAVSEPKWPSVLMRNLAYLARKLGLSDKEARVLGFAVMLHKHTGLENTADLLGQRLNNRRVGTILETLLDLSPETMSRVLARDGALRTTGVLSVPMREGRLTDKLEIDDRLPEVLLDEYEHPEAMLRAFFCRTSEPSLGEADFSHIEADFCRLKTYLGCTARNGQEGVNVLFYGPPGTGKTELAKVLAQSLAFPLYEVNLNDVDGEPLDGEGRMKSYCLAQKTLSRGKRQLLLFDEVEGVLDSCGTKAWLNHWLEANPVPAIWVSNAVHAFDPAYIRRFDYVLHLGQPQKTARQRILGKHLAQLPVSAQWVEKLATHGELAPAVIERAAKVVRQLGLTNGEEVEQTLEQLMGNTLEAMRLPRKPRGQVQQHTQYRLDLLNPDRDIARLVKGLKRDPRARLCLYGPPGTGKTAFGHYLAQVLDRPLLLKRASDLLRPFVGESEQAIADMFTEAVQEGAVLLLDEADSFLRDRAGASRSWEVTQVNEMLTQMETFDSVFVASTNLMDCLDEASLRRFDLKIRFGFLRPEQSASLFEQVLEEQTGAAVPLPAGTKDRLASFGNLTPGDFATVLRQRRWDLDTLSPEALLSALAAECRIKKAGAPSAIGFTAPIPVRVSHVGC